MLSTKQWLFLNAKQRLFFQDTTNEAIEMPKRNAWAVITILQLLFRFYEHKHTADELKFTTKPLFPRFPVNSGVMSSSTTSSSADYREKRTPPPGKRTGAAGLPPTGAVEAFPPLSVTRETQYRSTSSSPSMPEKEKEKRRTTFL